MDEAAEALELEADELTKPASEENQSSIEGSESNEEESDVQIGSIETSGKPLIINIGSEKQSSRNLPLRRNSSLSDADGSTSSTPRPKFNHKISDQTSEKSEEDSESEEEESGVPIESSKSYGKPSKSIIRSESTEQSKQRGRPRKLRNESSELVVISDEEDSVFLSGSSGKKRSRSRSAGRPQRKRGKPKKFLCDNSSSESEDENKGCAVNRRNLAVKRTSSRVLHSYQPTDDESDDNGTRAKSRSKSICTVDCFSDKLIDSFAKKQKLSDNLPKITGDKDAFCWQCHRDGSKMLFCHICPRTYHKRCVKIEKEPVSWICIECNSAMVASSFQNKSEVRGLSQERLNQLFKFIMERIYSHEGAEHFKSPVDLNQYSNYRDFIIHPMDLSLVEKNINNSKYKTTESFVADIKWLLHNSYIFNSAYSKLTSYARGILKSVKQEREEIENCPYCYYHYHTLDDDSWFVEPCKKPHLIVWAKLRGYPHWPAKVIRMVDDLVDVRFFGDHNRSFLSPDCCYLFSKTSPILTKLRNHIGYSDCLKEVYIHIKKLQDKFNEFCFAAPRIKYKPAEHTRMLHQMLPSLNSSDTNLKMNDIVNKKINDEQKDGPSVTDLNADHKIIKSNCLEANSSNNISQMNNLKVAEKEENATVVVRSPVNNNIDSNCQMVEDSDDVVNKLSGSIVNTSDRKTLMNKQVIPTTNVVQAKQPENELSITNNCSNEIPPLEIKSESSDRLPNNTIEQLNINLCKVKRPQVILTRISLNSDLNLVSPGCKKEPIAEKISSGAESKNNLILSDRDGEKDKVCGDIRDNKLEKRESFLQVDLSTDSTDVNEASEVPSNRIMLKVKSSAELLSSEALLRQNSQEGSNCSVENDFDESNLSNELTASTLSCEQTPSDAIEGCSITKKNSQIINMNDTIEKVIRGNITVTLPSRELRGSKTCAEKLGKDKGEDSNKNVIELDSETDYDSYIEELDCTDVDDDEMECFTSSNSWEETVVNPDLEKELELGQNIIDIGAWSIEPNVSNSTITDSMNLIFDNIDKSQNVEECKNLVLKLKKLVFLQTEEMKNLYEKLKNESEEVFSTFLDEKEKLLIQKKDFNRKVRNLKLRQWCTFCLKEANFYCCSGTSYCSRDCQHKDWDSHINRCKQSNKDKQHNDRPRVADTFKINKFTLSPAVTINRLGSNSSLTVNKNPSTLQSCYLKPATQTSLVANAVKHPVIFKQNNVSSKPVESVSKSPVTIGGKSLFSQNSPNSKIIKVSQGVIENGGSMPPNTRRPEPKKLIIRQDQLKKIGESVSQPGYYKVPITAFQTPKNSSVVMSSKSGIYSQQYLLKKNSHVSQQPPASVITPHDSKIVVVKQHNCFVNPDSIKTIPLKQASASS